MAPARSTFRPLALALAAATIVAGCDAARPAPRRSNSARAAQRDSRGLFESIVAQVGQLPEAAQLELAPPTVVLDARSTSDGEEIRGILRRRPEAPGEPANLISVPRGNVRFREAVRPGDLVKYYGIPDDATRRRVEETAEVNIETGQRDYSTADIDVATFDAVDMVVAQVLSDNELLIVGGYATEDLIDRRVEVWRIADKRMEEIQREWSAYVARREPPLAWHPSPDESSIAQLTERLNQWLRQAGLAGQGASAAGHKRPELLATLPASLAESDELRPFLDDQELATGFFTPHESRLIQGATWRRDVARWARGRAVEPREVAEALFDWTVRNVALVDPADSPPRSHWEVMLLGKGTAASRAGVAAGLCEQQNLTAAVVSVPIDDGAEAYLLLGVVEGAALRLFDPRLGLPLPRAAGDGVLTLAEAQADDAALRRLDLPDAPYPLTAERMRRATVAVVADPFALTRRAAEFGSRLSADDRLVLGIDVDAVAGRLAQVGGVAATEGGKPLLWTHPFETLTAQLRARPSERRQAVREFLPFAWRPILWRGRLQHFRGVREDPAAKRDVLDEALDDHLAAQRYYMDVRPGESRLAEAPEDKRAIFQGARSLATLFLAQLRYDEGSYGVAAQWLENPAMKDPSAESLRPMVAYLRGRALEAQGELDAAADALEAVTGPMAPGARLRAAGLRERAAPEQPEAAATDARTPEAPRGDAS